MRIEKRIVSRWFLDGKGYASETAAYLAWAKQHLNGEILDVILGKLELGDDPFLTTEEFVQREFDTKAAIRAEFARRFPPCGTICCQAYGGGSRDFCNTARWDWLRAKAKELKECDTP